MKEKYMKAQDEFTRDILHRLDTIKRFEDDYKQAWNTAMICAMFDMAYPLKNLWGGKVPKTKFIQRVHLRMERAFVKAKKQLRAYEKAHGLTPVVLDILGKDYGCRLTQVQG